MARWQLRAGVLMTVLGFVGCSSGGIMTPTASSATASLVGPNWTVTKIGGKSVLEGTTLTAAFSSEERVAGNAGCNGYFGRAQAEAGRLSVGPLGSTRMACGDGVMEQEMLYLASLQAATSYTIQGDELRLGPSAGQVTLVFAPR